MKTPESLNKKIIYILYRVSTKKQVHKVRSQQHGAVKTEDDIPMQRMACHEFVATKENWVIGKEFKEAGVSGSKVSADDRDAIQDLKEAALRKEFDVLLVWKLDRLGRIKDETPFVLKWFVEKGGVEVWSATEGQRKFENNIDDLINYITFWQADTESRNTALRIAERMRQLKEEGAYTGGPIPLGFKLENKGRMSKKGQPVGDIVIDEDAARCVREKIFYRFHNDGYGTYTLTDLLQAEGVKGAAGKPIYSAAVKRILRNERYRGTIVEEDVFDRVQAMLDARADAKNEARKINLQTRAKALLSGNIFCGHCGKRMSSTVKSGKLFYFCYNKHHPREMGQKTYLAEPVDAAVEQAVISLFHELKDRPKDSVIADRYMARVAMLKEQEGLLVKSISQKQEVLGKLQLEIVKALTGDSVFSQEDLAGNIQAIKDEIGKIEGDLLACRDELADKEKSYQSLEPTYTRFRNWADEYMELSKEKKRVIICELISRIEMRHGYDIRIIFDLQYEQFCRPLENELALLQI